MKWCCVARDHQSTPRPTSSVRSYKQRTCPDFIHHAYLPNSSCWKYPHRATRMCQQPLRFQEPRWVRRSVVCSKYLLADPLCALSGTICPLGGTHRVILLPRCMWLPSMEGICLYIVYALLWPQEWPWSSLVVMENMALLLCLIIILLPLSTYYSSCGTCDDYDDWKAYRCHVNTGIRLGSIIG